MKHGGGVAAGLVRSVQRSGSQSGFALVRGLPSSAARRIAVAASKAHRFAGEMEQIAETQGSAGTSAELFAGMAAVYRRLAATDLAALSPEEAADLADLSDVLRRLA